MRWPETREDKIISERLTINNIDVIKVIAEIWEHSGISKNKSDS